MLFDEKLNWKELDHLSLAINDLLSDLPPYIQTSLYVDDFAVFSRSTTLPAAVRRTQLAVNKAHLWCDRHGFKFSTSKSVVMHFTKIRGAFPPIDIQLGSFTLPFVNETKFLGLLLDRKLSYIPHIKLVRTKCLRSMDILKCLAHNTWGSDRVTLLRVYRSHGS